MPARPLDEALDRLTGEISLNRPYAGLAEAALLSLAWTWQRLEEAGREFFRAHGITEAQFNVLMILRDYGERRFRQHELADILVVNRASAGAVLERLEREGWIARTPDPGDRRAMRVAMTAAGRRKLEEVRRPYYRRLAEIFRGQEERDLRALIVICDRLRAGLPPAKSPPSPTPE